MIREAIRNFLAINFAVEIKNDIKKDFNIKLAESNLLRGKIVAVLLITIEFVVIIFSIISNPSEIITRPKGYYYSMYLLLIFVMSISLMFLNYFSKGKHKNHNKLMVMVYILTTFVLFWNMLISLLDQMHSGNLLSYFTTLIATCVIIYMKPKPMIIIYSLVQISFIVLLPFFLPAGITPYDAYVNTTIAAMVSCFIGFILYRQRVNDFVNRSIIEQKNEQLSILNEKLKESNKTLEYLSQTDGLTGIYNRRMFDKLSKSYWKKCIKNNYSLSVIMMDIDHFKEYNDNFGHQAGDNCLKKLVKTISKTINKFNNYEDSMLARYGGEEFILMVCNMSKETSFELSENIRLNVSNLGIERIYNKVANQITLSLGLYRGVPSEETTSLLDYIENADRALYAAKKAGRNITMDEMTVKCASKFRTKLNQHIS